MPLSSPARLLLIHTVSASACQRPAANLCLLPLPSHLQRQLTDACVPKTLALPARLPSRLPAPAAGIDPQAMGGAGCSMRQLAGAAVLDSFAAAR